MPQVLQRAHLVVISPTLLRGLPLAPFVHATPRSGMRIAVSVIVMPDTLALVVRRAYLVVWVNGRAILEQCLALHVNLTHTRSRSQLHHRPLVPNVHCTLSQRWAVLPVLALPGTQAQTARSAHLVVLAHTSPPLDLRLAFRVMWIPTRLMWRLSIVLNVHTTRQLQKGATHLLHVHPGVQLVCTTT